MGHHARGYMGDRYSDPSLNSEQREKIAGIIRKNRKKILIIVAILVFIFLAVIIFIGYIILTALFAGKEVLLNPNTVNQAQKIASEGAKLVPQNLPTNGLLQNFQWIINIINTFQSLGG